MTYVNIKVEGVVETVDQFETYREARKVCKEYNFSDSTQTYYTSSRSTKEWRES